MIDHGTEAGQGGKRGQEGGWTEDSGLGQLNGYWTGDTRGMELDKYKAVVRESLGIETVGGASQVLTRSRLECGQEMGS